jgi:hypothetical protein
MPAEQVEHYILRASDFVRGMKMTQGDEFYRNSSALLAIHSAVSYADALRVGLGDSQLSNDDHRVTADRLKRLLADRKYPDTSGLTHLQYLISKKSRIAYGDQGTDLKECQMLATKAERFARWVNQVGTNLKVGGWKHDDN